MTPTQPVPARQPASHNLGANTNSKNSGDSGNSEKTLKITDEKTRTILISNVTSCTGLDLALHAINQNYRVIGFCLRAYLTATIRETLLAKTTAGPAPIIIAWDENDRRPEMPIDEIIKLLAKNPPDIFAAIATDDQITERESPITATSPERDLHDRLISWFWLTDLIARLEKIPRLQLTIAGTNSKTHPRPIDLYSATRMVDDLITSAQKDSRAITYLRAAAPMTWQFQFDANGTTTLSRKIPKKKRSLFRSNTTIDRIWQTITAPATATSEAPYLIYESLLQKRMPAGRPIMQVIDTYAAYNTLAGTNLSYSRNTTTSCPTAATPISTENLSTSSSANEKGPSIAS